MPPDSDPMAQLEDLIGLLQAESPEPASASSPSAVNPEHQPSPEQMRHRAHQLSSIGERREAADLLRRAVDQAESEDAEPSRLLPLVESFAEVLWQLNEKREARHQANRALHLWFRSKLHRLSGRPSH